MLMIIAGLDRTSFQASVICPKDGALTRLSEELKVPVSNVELLQARFTWRPDHLVKYLISFFGVIFKLRRMIVESSPNLIHANTIRAGLVATTATFGTGIPVLWHLHDMLPLHPFSTLIRWYAALSVRTSLLAISEAVAQRFRGGILSAVNGCKKVQVIHNGIELERFSNSLSLGQRVRHELKLRDEQFVIGIVGQITARKGQLELIQAFAEAVKQLPSAVLAIIGAPLFNNDGDYLSELKQTATALNISDRVIFTGARSDVPAVMQALDLLVLNSKVEPLGLVVLEAMACGTPVLATSVDGVPELINHKITGWLVQAKNKQQLIEGMVTLGNDAELRHRLAQAAKQQTVPRFSAQKYLRLVEDYYRQVGGERNESPNRELVPGS